MIHMWFLSNVQTNDGSIFGGFKLLLLLQPKWHNLHHKYDGFATR